MSEKDDPTQDQAPLAYGLDQKIAQAHWLLDRAIEHYVTNQDKTLVGTVVCFSGGNDSTILAHLMRDRSTHHAHANTGIGIEETRVFVRKVSAEWGKPLIEKHPPAGSTYRDLVLESGFPGAGMHWKMYHRLKERALRQVRAELVKNGRRERVIFVAGRRRAESARREQREIPEMNRDRSVVWVSPIVHWTTQDMVAYRQRFDVPRNEVSDHLHMSGECLCGAFASRNELDEVGLFYPHVRAEIEHLEHEVQAAGIPAPRCWWGWGSRENIPEGAPTLGPLCDGCAVRKEHA